MEYNNPVGVHTLTMYLSMLKVFWNIETSWLRFVFFFQFEKPRVSRSSFDRDATRGTRHWNRWFINSECSFCHWIYTVRYHSRMVKSCFFSVWLRMYLLKILRIKFNTVLDAFLSLHRSTDHCSVPHFVVPRRPAANAKPTLDLRLLFDMKVHAHIPLCIRLCNQN